MSTELSTAFSEVSYQGAGDGQPQERRLDIKRLIRLRAPLILGVFLALGIPGVLAAYFLTPMEYTATADIRFLALPPKVLFDRGQNTPYEMFVNTQVNLLRGNDIMRRVLQRPRVAELASIQAAEDPLFYLKQSVRASNVRGSELVQVACTMRDPDEAKVVVEEMVDVYMDYAYSQEAEMGGDQLRQLSNMRVQWNREIDIKTQAIRDLRNAIPIAIPNSPQYGPGPTYSLREGITQAEGRLASIQSRIGDSEWRRERLEGFLEVAQGRSIDPIYEMGIEDTVVRDPRVMQLRQQVTNIELELAHARESRFEDDPQIKRIETRLSTIERQLREMERRVRVETITRMISDVDAQIVAAEREIENQHELIAKYKVQMDEQNELERGASNQIAQLEQLRKELARSESFLEMIEREITKLTVESNAPARVQRASPTVVPARPNHSKRKQLMVMSFGGALCVGFGIGLLRELMDQQVRSVQDVTAITRLPILAAVPHATEDKRLPGSMSHLIAAEHPDSVVTDELRRVLTRIIYPPESASELNTCLIASPTRGDGRTTLACNLAVSLADAGRRVLLIDINGRDPQVERVFGLEPGPGLGEILCGEYAPYDLTRPTTHENLHVLGPGLRGALLAGKLASRDMLDLLERAEHDFEHVLIDTPPALLMSDVKFLAPIADGVLVVVGVGVSTLGMVQRCLRELNQVGANVAGIVLNGIRSTRGGYLRRNLTAYYQYSSNGANGKDAVEIPEMVIIGDDADDAPGDQYPAIILADEEDKRD